MNTNGCNSLQVSTNVSLETDGQPTNISNSFTSASFTGLVSDEVVTVPVGTMPVPIGGMTLAQLGFLFLQNLDQGNPLFVSLNADGSQPFEEIPPGADSTIYPVAGQAYYLNAQSSSIAVRVLAVGS